MMQSLTSAPTKLTDKDVRKMWPTIVSAGTKELLESGYPEHQAKDAFFLQRFIGAQWPSRMDPLNLSDLDGKVSIDITAGVRGLYVASQLNSIDENHPAAKAWESWTQAFGKDLHDAFGWDGMSAVNDLVRQLCGINGRYVERTWDGVGDWVR